MSRPVAINDDTIIKAARDIFLARGYQAGTAEIARRASVSEGSIFKRYKTKAALFQAAMDVAGYEKAWESRLMSAVGTRDIRLTLETAGDDLLKRLQTILPRIVMVNANGTTFAKACHGNQPPPPIRLIAILSRYFRAEMKAGRIRMTGPTIHAHAFVGALSHYVFCQTLFQYRAAEPRAYVRSLVETLLHGVAVTTKPCKNKKKASL